MRNAGGELAKRGEFFGLNQALLCCAKLFQRSRQFLRSLAKLVQQPRIFNCDHGLVGKVGDELRIPFAERLNFLPEYCNCAASLNSRAFSMAITA